MKEKKRLCDYCGEEEAIKTIFSPNADGTMWKVCLICEAVIEAQQKLTMGHMLKHMSINAKGRVHAQKTIDDAVAELESISKETGKEILSVTITKKEVDK